MQLRSRVLLISAALAVASAAQANLIVNGGFESSNVNGVILAGNGGYQSFAAGDLDVTGWTIGGNVDIVSNPGTWAFGVHSGVYALDLNGSPGPGSISQSFNSLTSSFLVSFWSSSNELGQGVTVDVNGNTIAVLPTGLVAPGGIDGTYYNYSYLVTNGNIGANSLTFTIAPGSFGNTFLDDISVSSVPGPAAAVPMLLGLASGLRRRRSK